MRPSSRCSASTRPAPGELVEIDAFTSPFATDFLDGERLLIVDDEGEVLLASIAEVVAIGDLRARSDQRSHRLSLRSTAVRGSSAPAERSRSSPAPTIPRSCRSTTSRRGPTALPRPTVDGWRSSATRVQPLPICRSYSTIARAEGRSSSKKTSWSPTWRSPASTCTSRPAPSPTRRLDASRSTSTVGPRRSAKGVQLYVAGEAAAFAETRHATAVLVGPLSATGGQMARRRRRA